MTDAAIVRIDDASFLAVAHASIARREGAAAAGFDVVPAPGPLAVVVSMTADTLTAHLTGGVFEIRQAAIASDGIMLAATLVARGDVGETLLLDVLSEPSVTTFAGTAVRTQAGLEMVSIQAAALPMAA